MNSVYGKLMTTLGDIEGFTGLSYMECIPKWSVSNHFYVSSIWIFKLNVLKYFSPFKLNLWKK